MYGGARKVRRWVDTGPALLAVFLTGIALAAPVASASTATEISALPIRDALQRSENPLSNEGKWLALGWATAIPPTGRVRAEGWRPGASFPELSGAFWSPASFSQPDAVAVTMGSRPANLGQYDAIWLEMSAPGVTKSGYELTWNFESNGIFAVAISKWSGGVQTTLATTTGVSIPSNTTLALSDTGSTITAWKGSAGALTQIGSVEDSAYASGYTGMEEPGNKSSLANFQAGHLTPGPPSLTGTTPTSPANNNSPKVIGSAEAGTTVSLFTNSGCSGSPAATGSATAFASPGIPVSVANNTTTTFYATATSESGTSACSSSRVTYVEVPPIYWGAWMAGSVYESFAPWLREQNAPWAAETIEIFESNNDKIVGHQHAGKNVSIIHFGQPAPWNQAFAAGPLELTSKAGSIPLMDMGLGEIGGKPVTLTEIKNGSRDTELKQWATAVKNYGQPFFFRWAWEMNGTWFSWGKEAAEHPALFAEAWQHFHNLAEEQGATNITWVWCPNVSFSGSTSLSALYPGSTYVDWTCMDGYNEGGSAWRSFSSTFASTYNELLSIAPSKPIMIGETASAESGGSKPAWIESAFEELRTTFPKIKAVNWFNWNIVEGGTEKTWPIESSESSAAAFAKAISSSYFAESTFGSLTPLTRIQPIE
jgi:Glycosyl hydrolase family 26